MRVVVMLNTCDITLIRVVFNMTTQAHSVFTKDEIKGFITELMKALAMLICHLTATRHVVSVAIEMKQRNMRELIKSSSAESLPVKNASE